MCTWNGKKKDNACQTHNLYVQIYWDTSIKINEYSQKYVMASNKTFSFAETRFSLYRLSMIVNTNFK